MIEIKITIDDAIKLLLERMNQEVTMRQKDGLLAEGVKVESLPYKELLSVVETSVFDTMMLLPPDLVLGETNLKLIITKTIQTLARTIGQEELVLYSYKQTEKLLSLVTERLKAAADNKNFQYN
jgi:hypothetical protein